MHGFPTFRKTKYEFTASLQGHLTQSCAQMKVVHQSPPSAKVPRVAKAGKRSMYQNISA